MRSRSPPRPGPRPPIHGVLVAVEAAAAIRDAKPYPGARVTRGALLQHADLPRSGPALRRRRSSRERPRAGLGDPRAPGAATPRRPAVPRQPATPLAAASAVRSAWSAAAAVHASLRRPAHRYGFAAAVAATGVRWPAVRPAAAGAEGAIRWTAPGSIAAASAVRWAAGGRCVSTCPVRWATCGGVQAAAACSGATAFPIRGASSGSISSSTASDRWGLVYYCSGTTVQWPTGVNASDSTRCWVETALRGATSTVAASAVWCSAALRRTKCSSARCAASAIWCIAVAGTTIRFIAGTTIRFITGTTIHGSYWG